MKITAGKPLDMSETDLSGWFDGIRYSVTNTSYKLRGGEEPITFSGHGFEVNRNGYLVDGVVMKLVIGSGWDKTTYSGFTLDAEVLSKAIRSHKLSDDAALWSKMLSGNDVITGSNQFDTLFGFKGNDRISGDSGDDILNGGKGRDTLIGGWGADDLTGGRGADVFYYSDQVDSYANGGIDEILDFSRADGDKINLREVGDLEFIGASDAPGDSSELRYYFQNGNTIIETDVSGNGFLFFKVKIRGEIALTEADFIL